MISKKYIILLLAALLLGGINGCKIGPNYKRPDTTLGKQYRFSNQTDTLSFADTSWTKLFRDTVLQNMIRQGIKANFDLRIAISRVNQAMAQFKSARADLYPSVSAQGAAAYNNVQRPPSGTGTVEYNDLYATGNLSWELDIWGKLRRAKESARAQLLSQEAYQQATYISLISSIAQGYYSLLEYRDELRITRENVRIREEAFALVKAKMIAGTASGLVVAQAEAELATVKTQIPALEKAIGIQENAIRLLLGDLPGEIKTGSPMMAQVDSNILPKTGIPSRLIVRRPDLIAAEQQLVSANAQIGVARGMMMPTLTINASAGYSTLGAGIIGSAVGGLVAPIFNFGKLRANLHKSQAYHEEILATYQKAIYTAIGEVSDGMLSVDKMKQMVNEQRNLNNAAQTAFDLSNQLYNAGYASYLDVINAQRLLYQAEIQLSQAELNSMQSVVQLYLALGGGWK
ncbi:MAG: efflux transporter outer membrane subunit [Bacteroidetes bacterium]|nr:efflux transporter outer membrane subunit [Bacteroidota bacterium]